MANTFFKLYKKIKEREDQTITAPTLVANNEGFKCEKFFLEGTITDIKKILWTIYMILEGDQMFRSVKCFSMTKHSFTITKRHESAC